MTPYLVQAAKFKDECESDGKGIDSILRMDYMGAAEFEFGALPASLKRIRANLSHYHYYTLVLSDEPKRVVTVFCAKGDEQVIMDAIESLTKDNIRLKARCDLKDWVNPGRFPYQRNDFWWDIDHDFMFWKDALHFKERFKKCIATIK